MSIRMLLVACLVAASLADSFQIQQCTSGNATGPKLSIELAGCSLLTFGDKPYNLSLTGVKGSNLYQNLTAVGNSFTDNKCKNANPATTDISCTCASDSQFTFVCDGASFAVPSLLVLVASVMVYMM
eukprot:TRINITY_DN48_c0_g1_i19.p1 TRINITY_DN48_c0_g1~~TRINITY_DN48_c0_g1_i19.p1  ORF type:complete len:139 (+),score=41.51 TRINITY_DN48_c0_g1_i19:37-417(+)